jgi:microcystin-dependent protein
MEYYLGEILSFAFPRVPYGTAVCNGQTMSIQTNSALYSLLGQVWGGSGSNFGLPNLCGRAMVGLGTPRSNSGVVVGTLTWDIGYLLGTDAYTISQAQLPAHVHSAVFTPTTSPNASSAAVAVSSNNGKVSDPNGNYLAKTYDSGTRANNLSYIAAADAGTLGTLAGVSGGGGGITGGTVQIGIAGASAPLVVDGPGAGVNFCIVTAGIYPSFD